MKKIITAILSVLCYLNISIVSLAFSGETITQDSQKKSGDITVGYNAEVTYTVTIPANVTFTDAENEIERPLMVTNVILNEGSTLNVNLVSQNNYKMMYGEGYIEYSLMVNYNDALKENNINILTVLAGESSGLAILDFITDLNKDHALYTGNYTDTLTFTVTID